MDGTVLIMDYSSYERQKIRHILEKAGTFAIVEVGSISQFTLLDLDILDLKLVLLDIMFSNEDNGFDVLRKIRASENKDVPVIVVTHSDKHEHKTEALKYAVNDYIIKPYQIKRLETSIRSFIKVISKFHYDTRRIKEIRMSFDDYVKREIAYSKRTQCSLSFILITTLQINKSTEPDMQASGDTLASIFAIAAQKAKDSLRITDTIVLNHDRDIIIVLPCTDEAGAQLVCDKLKLQMKLEFDKMKADKNLYLYPVPVTFPKDGGSFQLLMETAFKRISDKEMLERIVSIPSDTRKYADKSYTRYQKWF